MSDKIKEFNDPDLKDEYYNTYIKDTDIAVFQDFAGFCNETPDSVATLQKLFKPNVKFYYYSYLVPTEYINKQASKFNNIEFLKTEEVFEMVIKKYNDSTYFLTDDGHNRDMLSHIFAMEFYSQIFKADCSNLSYKKLIKDSLIPGSTPAERNSAMDYFKQCVKTVTGY